MECLGGYSYLTCVKQIDIKYENYYVECDFYQYDMNLNQSWYVLFAIGKYVDDPNIIKENAIELNLTLNSSSNWIGFKDDTSSTNINIPLNSWNHVKMLRENNKNKMYLNDKLVFEKDITIYNTNTLISELTIATDWSHGNYGFYGKLKNFKFVVGEEEFHKDLILNIDTLKIFDNNINKEQYQGFIYK